MRTKDIEQLIEDCEGLIQCRSDLIFKKFSKTKRYKNEEEEYYKLRKELITIAPEDLVGKFENAMYDMNTTEVNYNYLQGFVDGVLLREYMCGNK